MFPESRSRRFFPLYVQIILAVILGCTAGVFFGKESAHFWANDSLGELGFAIIRLLKIFAIPLIFFAIVDTILKTEISGKNAFKVLGVCLFNVTVAMLIGLFILNLFQPGKSWEGKIHVAPPVAPKTVQPSEAKPAEKPAESKPSLDPLQVVAKLVPESIVEPFNRNNTLSVILLAVLFGFSLRQVRHRKGEASVQGVVHGMEVLFETVLRVIGLIVHVIPIAVFCMVAQAVGKSGLAVFETVWVFLVTILAGFTAHALIYYTLAAWFVGRKSPRVFWGQGASTVLTAFSVNSSLATMPMTLDTLSRRMGVSETSARLSACFATNFNNDGITLYEAMAALFIAQAIGGDLAMAAQVMIVVVSIFVSMGIAGIPEAGLIILPLVLGATGLSDQTIAAAIALIVPVDWLIARLRSAVNVLGDMTVAVMVDKL